MADMNQIINHETMLHNKIHLEYDENNQQNEVKHLNKGNYELENIYPEIDYEAMKQFVWKFRFDYLAFGYNPNTVLSKLNYGSSDTKKI